MAGSVTGTRRWRHAWLSVSHNTASTRGRRETIVGRVVHRTRSVAPRDASSGSLLHADLVALGYLALELLPSNLTALSERDIERFGTNHLVVHLCDSLGGLLGAGITNETEPFRVVLIVAHDFGAGNGPKRLKLGTEFFVVDVVVDILDIKVDALIFAQLLHLGLLVRLPQLFLTFGLLLGPVNKKLTAKVRTVMELLQGLGSTFVISEVDESKAFGDSVIILPEDGRSDLSILSEQVCECLLSNFLVQALDIKVGVLLLLPFMYFPALLVTELY